MPGGTRSRWGWFALTDAAACRIVADAEVGSGELVLDIGAGEGALTRPLVATGARVRAIELHPRRARVLRERFSGVTVIECSIEDLRLPRHAFRVVANPPFSCSSVLVRRLLDSRVTSADLVVPVQVAQRWAHKRPDRCSYRRLPRHSFRPQAPVATAVLRIRRPTGRR